jgi:hypothetical protein
VSFSNDFSSFLPFMDTNPSATPSARPLATESVRTARLDCLSPLKPADVIGLAWKLPVGCRGTNFWGMLFEVHDLRPCWPS